MNKALDKRFSLSVPLRLFTQQYLLGGTLVEHPLSLPQFFAELKAVDQYRHLSNI
jgi:hypothetical protein